MLHPETGVERDYEEVWRAENPMAIPAGKPASDHGDDRVVCVVLQTENHEQPEQRGQLVRLGQYCQGILRTGHQISVERWMWTVERGWEQQARFGDQRLPVQALIEEDINHLGLDDKVIDCAGRVWNVVETAVW
jgi:hypothetical protein